VRLLRDAVCALLADPAMTRRELRRRVLLIAKQLEEHGPEGVAEEVPKLELLGE
jgi:hypothetical protein